MTRSRNPHRRVAAGFTLVEVMVVTGISVLLMTVGALIYSACLRVYQNSQGTTDVFETAKFINNDMRTYLGQTIPLKGTWIKPICKGITGCSGVYDATNSNIDQNYLASGNTDLQRDLANGNVTSKALAYTRDEKYDPWFSGAQYAKRVSLSVAGDFWKDSLGYVMSTSTNYQNWHSESVTYPGFRGWWLPAFYGLRNAVGGESGVSATDLASFNDVRVGAWGWPRPDYRLDADADKITGGTAALTDGGNVACWFYAEERAFNSPYTLTLDNANIVLVSLKFSIADDGARQSTQLSVLRHQIVGFDTPTYGLVRADHSYGNLLRRIKIDPLFFNPANGAIERASAQADQGDTLLGWNLSNGGPTLGVTDGDRVPCAFDVEFVLRNPRNMQGYRFATRIFQFGNPQ
ncbi:MAG: hypothetical protein AMXMBFR7_42170 [Planctomycetota bacterium]